eukprot:SAG31_NODE_48258_length_196_cov_57.216495_1_plen_42_part_10
MNQPCPDAAPGARLGTRISAVGPYSAPTVPAATAAAPTGNQS